VSLWGRDPHLRDTAVISHRTPEASHGRRADLGSLDLEMIHEVLEVMTDLAKEGVR